MLGIIAESSLQKEESFRSGWKQTLDQFKSYAFASVVILSAAVSESLQETN